MEVSPQIIFSRDFFLSKNHERALDSLNASLEAEQIGKIEALRIKKKMEADINDLEISLDQANKAHSEANKTIKRYQGQLREAEAAWEQEHRARLDTAEKVSLTDRKALALTTELEEAQSQLDTADRGKLKVDQELAASRAAVAEMTDINQRAVNQRRSVEGEIQALQAELEDVMYQVRNAEEKAGKALVDASRLAEELQSEQSHVTSQEMNKRSRENQLQDLEFKCQESSEAAARNGKAVLTKLERKVQELEIELGGCQSRTSENIKQFHKSERKIKELEFQQNEEKKNQNSLTDLAAKLQQKMKTYKKQIEEAEEIAALNLAKFRAAQQEVEEAEERVRLADCHPARGRRSTELQN